MGTGWDLKKSGDFVSMSGIRRPYVYRDKQLKEKIMKVKLKFRQKAYNGKLDGLVYYWHPRYKTLCARRLPEFYQPTEAKHRFSLQAKNLKALSPSSGYRSDLKTYLKLLQDKDIYPRLNSWYPLFIILMTAFATRHPEYDLTTLSREDIYSQQLSCRSVKCAVEDFLLPRVSGYEVFDKEL